jgi:hypothetical protein
MRWQPSAPDLDGTAGQSTATAVDRSSSHVDDQHILTSIVHEQMFDCDRKQATDS